MSLRTLRWLLLGLLAVGILGSGAAQGAGTATGGLVAAYSFNSSGATAADSSGNGHTATVSNATWTSAGKYGGALSFNGSSSIVSVPDSASLDLTSGLTIEAWVQSTANSASSALVTKERAGGGFPWGLELVNGVPNAYVDTGTSNRAASPSALPLSTWKFVAVAYDGSYVRLYLDGVQVAADPATGSIATSAGQLSLGADTVWGEYFAGKIDNVRIYNRAVTTAELQSDMSTPLDQAAPPPPPPPAKTPVAAYAF